MHKNSKAGRRGQQTMMLHWPREDRYDEIAPALAEESSGSQREGILHRRSSYASSLAN